MLDSLGLYGLRRRQVDVRRLLEADGASYRLQTSARPQPWKLDAVPLLVPQSDWAGIEAGVAQRATLLDLVVRDLYGERRLLERGVIPPEVVFRHPGFVPACDGTHLPDGSQLFTYAVDIGRDHGGESVALADYAQAPSGSGYALENRVVLSESSRPCSALPECNGSRRSSGPFELASSRSVSRPPRTPRWSSSARARSPRPRSSTGISPRTSGTPWSRGAT